MKKHTHPISQKRRLPIRALEVDLKSIVNQWMLTLYNAKFGTVE